MTDLLPQLLNVVSGAIALLVAIPIGVFCLECFVAVLPRWGRAIKSSVPRGRAVVLIPAHNEEDGIVSTLDSVRSALADGDELVVIADNCTDRTKELVESAGVQVWERFNSAQRGKGFALNFGIERLRASPPDVVIALDADCRVSPNTIDLLSRRVTETQRPVQAQNLCQAGSSAGGDPSLASLGHRFCCLVRPTGAARLGMPCSLMGTGMAFPWPLIERLPFDGDHLAEDKLLGIEMTLDGHPPSFCPQAQVQSAIPEKQSAFMSQRRRWEHGHLRLALTQIPRLLKNAARRGCLRSLWMALDISVPPLALLVLAWMAAFVFSATGWFLGASILPILALMIEGALLGLAVVVGWFRFCRQDLPLSVFAGIPGYIFRKLPLYASFFLGKGQRAWIRTPRETSQKSVMPS